MELQRADTGTVFDIQNFSLHDGDGIRTTVFLKGCNNRCIWCHNPESYSSKPQLRYFPSKCIGCGECLKVCRHGAIRPDGIDPALCVGCGECARVCPAEAREICGKLMTVAEVMERVLPDKPFYETSDGGMTLSGGEPLLQPGFCLSLLSEAKAEGISCGIQTAANVPYEHIAPLLPYTDFIMLDIKLFDDEKHKRYTGVSNRLIIENALRLSKEPLRLIIRTPVIAGINDTEDELGHIRDFISGFPNLEAYRLLTYHDLGEGKKESLFMQKNTSLSAPTDERMAKLRASFELCRKK